MKTVIPRSAAMLPLIRNIQPRSGGSAFFIVGDHCFVNPSNRRVLCWNTRMARSVVTPVVEDSRLAGHDVNQELVLAHRAEQQIPRSAVEMGWHFKRSRGGARDDSARRSRAKLNMRRIWQIQMYANTKPGQFRLRPSDA